MSRAIIFGDSDIDYRIIDTKAELQQAINIFSNQQTVAVDVEADSMYHYRDKVCLIQIASEKLNAVIDPLLIKDMSELRQLFKNPYIKKVFHGADYDVRCLHRDFGIEINNLFDTQLACRFLGKKETGLEAVIRKTFNIVLNKKYQKKDWSKRPLPKDMIDYAVRDAVYLAPLGELLQNELEKKGRLFWVWEECNHLSRVRYAPPGGRPLFLRFKGAGRFKPRGLAVLESLLQFREHMAEKKDKPVFRIFLNEALIKMAVARPVTVKRLKKLNVLSKKQTYMYGEELVRAINEAMNLPENQLPVYPRKQAPVLAPGVPERIRVLKLRRDTIARSLQIDPALLCNKALLYAIAVRNPIDLDEFNAIDELKDWQKEVIGPGMADILKKIDRKTS